MGAALRPALSSYSGLKPSSHQSPRTIDKVTNTQEQRKPEKRAPTDRPIAKLRASPFTNKTPIEGLFVPTSLKSIDPSPNMSSPPAHHHPTSLRNRDPIADRLVALVSSEFRGNVLEVAAGTGALLEVLRERLPSAELFQPTEYVPPRASDDDPFAAHGKLGTVQGAEELAVIDAVGADVCERVARARHLDLTTNPDVWELPIGVKYDVVHCGNTIHIAPYPVATDNLFEGAQRILNDGGFLTLYGPFKVRGKFTTVSNEEFDAKLRAMNPSFGLREVDEVVARARIHGLELLTVHDMPANNLFIAFQKRRSEL